VAKLQELREKREALRGEIEKTRQVITERRDKKDFQGVILTPEERTAFDKLKTDYLGIKQQVEAEEGAADVEKFLTDEIAAEERSRRGAGGRMDPAGDDKLPGAGATYGDLLGGDRNAYRQFAQAEERRALAFSGWALAGRKDVTLTTEQRQAIHDTGFDLGGQIIIRGLDTPELRTVRDAVRPFAKEERMARADRMLGKFAESRAVAAITGATDKGNLAPTVTTMALEKAALTIGGLYNAADVMVTADGNKLVWPTANDTSNEGKQIDEVTAESLDGTKPTVSSFSVASWEFWSNFIRLGNQTMRDSPVALATEIGLMIGERLARIINRRATNGVGTTTLRGIELGLTAGALMVDATTYTWQDLYKLKYSLDGAFREVGSFMMNDEVLVQLMLLTDDNGLPILIEPNDGTLPRLLQRPVVQNNHMVAHGSAGTAASGRPALVYGDLKKYKLRLVGDIRTMRYVERFAEYDQTAFDGKRGADGGLLNAGTPPVKGYYVEPE
jgi:HK97 family phage major capsid protein